MQKYLDIFTKGIQETTNDWKTFNFEPSPSDKVEKSRSIETNLYFDISLYLEDELEIKSKPSEPSKASNPINLDLDIEKVVNGRGSARKAASKSIASKDEKTMEYTYETYFDLPSPKKDEFVHEVDPLFKTEICKQWKDGKPCKFGKNCKYAHGIDELRDKERHKKFKTILCKKYHETGICPYGSRCSFIHDEPFISKEIKKSRLECFEKRTIGFSLPIDNSSSILPQFKNVELF